MALPSALGNVVQPSAEEAYVALQPAPGNVEPVQAYEGPRQELGNAALASSSVPALVRPDGRQGQFHELELGWY